MDLCQQTTDSIADLCDLACQILVKTAQHRELGDLTVGQLERAKCTRQAAGGLWQDVGIPSVGLGFTDMPDRRYAASQVLAATFVTHHGDRKHPHRGGLIHDEKDLPVFFELADQRSQFRLVIGQGVVQETFALAVQCDGMTRSLTYIDVDEHLDAVMLLNVSHACSRGLQRGVSELRQLISASTLQANLSE